MTPKRQAVGSNPAGCASPYASEHRHRPVQCPDVKRRCENAPSFLRYSFSQIFNPLFQLVCPFNRLGVLACFLISSFITT